MAEHRKRSQLFGDFAREFAVLWAALYPLEAFLNHSFRWKYCAGTYVAVAVLLTCGIFLEGRDPNERASAKINRFRLLLDRMRRRFVFSKGGTEAGGTAKTATSEPMEE